MVKKIFWLAVLVAVWAAGAEKYNYYERDFADGSFSLENLDLPPEMEFSYESVADAGGVVTEVRGYYYQSDKLKFIDTIENNRIMKIQYFAPDGVEIFVRTHAYDGERLCEFEIVPNEEYGYRLKSTFDYKNQRYSIAQSGLNSYEGKLDSDGKPIYGKIIRPNVPPSFGELEEKWTYKKDRVDYQVVLRKGGFSYKVCTQEKTPTEIKTIIFFDSLIFEYIQQHEKISFFELLALRFFGIQYTKFHETVTDSKKMRITTSNKNKKGHQNWDYDVETFKGRLKKLTNAADITDKSIRIESSDEIIILDQDVIDRQTLVLPYETEIDNFYHDGYRTLY